MTNKLIPCRLTMVVDERGDTHFYKENTEELHNPNGPAVIWSDGTKRFYLNGKLHNENGPAIIYSDGAKYFYLNGKLHNENGPAIIRPDGSKEFYLNHKEYSEQEYSLEMEKRRKPVCDPECEIVTIRSKTYKLVPTE